VSTKLPLKPYLTEAVCRRILDAALARARELELKLSVAVVDEGGHLLAFARMDDVHAATVEVAQAKARSAALFKRPTAVFQEGVAKGGIGLLTMPEVVPYEGGVPLTVDGHVIGAVGASGSSPDKDGAVSTAGASALQKELAA